MWYGASLLADFTLVLMS